jgi:hypothetical protein
MFGRIKSAKPVVAVSVGVVGLLVIGGGSAAAKALITGKDIKNGSIHLVDLGAGTKAKLHGAKGATGATGATGARGATGSQGATGPAGAQGPKGNQGDQGNPGRDGIQIVTEAGGNFSVSNPSVKFTDNGVVYGPYTDSGNEGGTVKDVTLAGLRVRDLASLTYTAKNVGPAANGAAPYLRIFIDNNGDGFDGSADDHDIIFSASTQPGGCATSGTATDQCASSGRMIKYIVNEGTVRYDDDGGNAPDVSWDSIINAHGSDRIDSVRISVGFALPGTTDSVVNSLSYEVAGRVPHTVSFSS